MASRLLAVPAALLFSLASFSCLAADGTRWAGWSAARYCPSTSRLNSSWTRRLTSSMHAEDLDYFEKDGDKWVRFDLDLRTWSRTSWSSRASSASCSAS